MDAVELGNLITAARNATGESVADVAAQTGVSDDDIERLERGEDVGVHVFVAICEALGLDLSCLTGDQDHIVAVGGDDETPCHLLVSVNGMVCDVYLDHVTIGEYKKLVAALRRIYQSSKKRRDCVAEAFIFATNLCPKANPSDLYHHVIYRQYLDPDSHSAGSTADNLSQSWVRTSGEGFEQALCDHYNPALKSRGIALVPTFSRDMKKRVIAALGLQGKVTESKIDLCVTVNHDGSQLAFGGVHAKASLAERVSDDIPASRIMMEAGFLSILTTLDVKSFPPPQGNLLNEGELGTLANPSDKRRYVEVQGDFSACFSYNHRTIASPTSTHSGKRIQVLDFSDPQDAFYAFIVAGAKEWLSTTSSAGTHAL